MTTTKDKLRELFGDISSSDDKPRKRLSLDKSSGAATRVTSGNDGITFRHQQPEKGDSTGNINISATIPSPDLCAHQECRAKEGLIGQMSPTRAPHMCMVVERRRREQICRLPSKKR